MGCRRRGWKSGRFFDATFVAIVAAGVFWPAAGIATNPILRVAGPPDLNRYADILHDETASADARVTAAYVILSNGYEPEISEAVSLLAGQSTHPDKHIRFRIFKALSSILLPNAERFELIARMSRDPDPLIRNRAMLSLIRGSENAPLEIRKRVIEPAIASGLADAEIELWKAILNNVMNTRASSPILMRLVNEALHHVDADIRASATWIMSLPDYNGAAELLRLTTDRAPSVRAVAAFGLGRMHHDSETTVPALTKMLDDPSARVRAAAAKALSRFDTAAAPAMRGLRRALKDSDETVRKEAASSLNWIEESFGLTDSALLEKFKNPDIDVRSDAFEGIRQAGRWKLRSNDSLSPFHKPVYLPTQWLSGEVLEAVMKATDDPDSFLRAEAVATLGRFGPASDEVIALVVSKFVGDERWVRESASRALIKFGPEARAAVPALIGFMRGKDKGLRRYAHWTLRYMGVELAAVAPGLAAVAEEETGVVRQDAVSELRRIAWRSEIARKTLEKLDPHTPGKLVAAPAQTATGQDVRYLSDDGLQERLWKQLRRLRPARGRRTDTLLSPVARARRLGAVEQFILTQLRDPDPDVRINTAEALWPLDRQQAAFTVPVLVELVQQDEYAFVREAAAWVLGKHGGGKPGVVDALTAATADSYASVQKSATLSLARLGAEAAPSLPVLIDSLAELDYPDCASLGQLLAEIDPSRAETMLVEKLNSDSRNMRRSAICALGAFPRRGMTFRRRQAKILISALKGSFGHGSEQIVATHVVRGWGDPFSRKLERTLVAALGDSDYSVRKAVLESFEQIGTQRAKTVSAIEDALGDRHPYVRSAAANTLLEIRPLTAAPAIRAALERERDGSTKDSFIYLLRRFEVIKYF